MTRTPVDYLSRWDLDEIGTLDETAFETPVPLTATKTHTITFWFLATNLTGKKVMANVGNKQASQTGWSVYLHDGQLVFRANFDGRHSQETAIPISDKNSWHHFTGIVDQESRMIMGYLDGSSSGWLNSQDSGQSGANAIEDSRRLIIGGYTDAAGGHFDHTFGRQGTGLVDDFRLYERALQPKEIALFLNKDKLRPTARFAYDQSRDGRPTTVHFYATTSKDENSTTTIFYWDFGDGQFASGSVADHTYAYRGAYRACLTVVNDDHEQDTVEQAVQIQDGDSPPNMISVFTNGQEGYTCYRIPSIIRATNGDLIAFAEGRLASCSDSTPVIRVVCKRSSDNGLTWSPLQVMARNILGDREYGCMNPSPVVDTVHGTGRIVVVFNKKEHSEWDVAKGKGINRTFCIFSDDHGRTWHGEKDITLQVHKPYNPSYKNVYPDAARLENKEASWRKQVPLPGHAIQLSGLASNPITRGRIFFAGSYTIGHDSIFDALNYAFWSDNLGESWLIGDSVTRRFDGSSAKGLNETMAVELENGDILINSRNYQDGKVVGRRAVAKGSFDEVGNIHFQPAYHDPTLVDSGVQASLIRFTRSDEKQYGAKSRLLFSNPDHPQARLNMTIRLSYDEGKTWPIKKVIDPGPSAYSDLVILNDGQIGLLYEKGNQGGIVFVSFTLDWLTDGQDSIDSTGNIITS